jgi:hypothetical protein
MILTKDMKVFVKYPNYRPNSEDRFEEGVVTKVGNKYATVKIPSGKEIKFKKIVFKGSDDYSVDTEFYHYRLIFSIDKYKRIEKETEIVQNFIAKALTGKIRPTYEQVLKICEILNIEV